MSSSCDAFRVTSETSGYSAKASGKRVSLDVAETEDLSPEAGFRGFEKVPLVRLNRLDILSHVNGISRRYDDQVLLKKLHLSRLSQKCEVSLVRDNLEKLIKSSNNLQVKEVDTSDSENSVTDSDMANIQCKICEKVYSSERKLQKHQTNKHMIVYKPQSSKPQKRVSFSDYVIVHEVKEYHKCRKCTKIFEDYKALKVHMKLQHKKRNSYICNYCNKNFMDRMFFKVHIKLHCDICGLLLQSKAKYLDHRRNVCRVLKLHKCKTCEETFFKFMDLKDHSYDHLNPFFICDICKDQFDTKCGVSHHISYLHSTERPSSLYVMRTLGSERLYLCNFCEESSVDRDLIESHVALLPDLTNRAMTGYKDYYFCDQCLKKFDTEQDMLQHKWTHFLKTSDNSQIRPKSILSKKKFKIKTTYKLDEKLPEFLKPNVVLEKIKIGGKVLKESIDFVDVKSFDERDGDIKKAVIDHKSKKTIISQHQCQNCDKYFSRGYCLTRHIETQHSDYENLRCKVCEETFVWPSLLQSHKCIRLNIPEMPFDDARPEIHFDNLDEITENGFDDLNIDDDNDYMNSIDFEIPAPVVELTESDSSYVTNNSSVSNVHFDQAVDKSCVLPLHNIGYKVIMQEVPIEF